MRWTSRRLPSASRRTPAIPCSSLGDQADLEPLLAALAEQEQSPRVYLLPAFVPRPLFEAPPAVAVDLIKKSYEPVGAWHEVR